MEDRGRRTGDRRRGTGDRNKKRCRMQDGGKDGGRETGDREKRTEDRGRKMEDGGSGAGVKNQQSKINNQKSPIATALQACAPDVPKKASVAWAQFVATLAQLEAEDIRTDASRMLRLAVEAGYAEYLKENYLN